MSYESIRPLLFSLDPETAHELVTSGMRRMQSLPGMLGLTRAIWGAGAGEERTIWGLRFRNPVGIAAGFDKNAELVPFLRALGFGFSEVGTVTLEPQPGNRRPRMFRYPRERALINRMGFNNDGAERVAGRLRDLWDAARASGDEWAPLFVNIGKNRSVPIDEAVGAYVRCYRLLAPWADGVVVNVSSPNTPGLRDLQNPSSLGDLVRALRAERDAIEFARPGEHPILVKVAPDLTDAQLGEIAEVCVRVADGMVATNTTVDHSAVASSGDEAGGLSGAPLTDRSRYLLELLRSLVGPSYPLIGVGGIMDGADAAERIAAGADLVQVYTGFIYRGPSFARDLVQGIVGRSR